MKYKFLFSLAIIIFFTANLTGCESNNDSPKGLLNTYFTSALKQEYSKAYTCYYKEYQSKISLQEYVKHRKEASLLQSYNIVSIKETGNVAHAEVELTFAPSKKFFRDKPVTVKANEDLIKEQGRWKIKVW